MSFLEELEKRKENLSMNREELALYAAKRQGEYTVEDYRRLPDEVRAELIDGKLVYMEAPGYAHQELITELVSETGNFSRSGKGSFQVIQSPLDVQPECGNTGSRTRRKRQSLLTGLKGRMFQASPCILFRTEYLCGSSGEGCRSTLEKSRKDCIFVRSL